MSIKILYDTDIGSDIDDAICLAYLLANPACDLLGVTTVSGEALARARMASALCRVAGKSVPIYPGCNRPLLIEQQQKEAGQARMLDRWPHDTDFPAGEAIEFLRRTIRAHPGEITLLGTGPMTNIATLFAADEEIPSLLKALVVMCGRFAHRISGLPDREWNALVDPEAAAMLYRARPPVHRSIGLDVTHQVTMPAADVRARFRAAALLRPVLDFAEVWFEHTDKITFHDPLAGATIFDPGICTFERGKIEVETKSRHADGLTLWHSDPDHGPHETSFDVDPARFFDHFFSVFA